VPSVVRLIRLRARLDAEGVAATPVSLFGQVARLEDRLILTPLARRQAGIVLADDPRRADGGRNGARQPSARGRERLLRGWSGDREAGYSGRTTGGRCPRREDWYQSSRTSSCVVVVGVAREFSRAAAARTPWSGRQSPKRAVKCSRRLSASSPFGGDDRAASGAFTSRVDAERLGIEFMLAVIVWFAALLAAFFFVGVLVGFLVIFAGAGLLGWWLVSVIRAPDEGG
jgi:hypothetical protein